MKSTTIQKLILGVAVTAASLLMQAPCVAGMIQMIPSATTVDKGDDFTVHVIAKDLNLGGFELTIGFQPLLSSLTLIEFGDKLGSPMSFQDGQVNVDQLDVDEVSFADGSVLLSLQGNAAVGNSFPLFALHFKAVNAGTAAFQFLTVALTDFNGVPVTATSSGTSVVIKLPSSPDSGGAVPEPATSALLAGGLGLMVFVARRKRGV